MANTLALKVVYNSALTAIGATDRLLFQAAGAFAYGAAGAIALNDYNGGFHIIDASNNELCTSAHPPNLKYIASGTVQIAGGGTVNLNTVTTAQCLNLLVSCSPNAQVTACSIFVYDGSTEANGPANWTVKGFKQGDSAWSNVAGSGNALSLGTDSSGATHNFYFGLSLSPTANGALTATLKLSATVV